MRMLGPMAPKPRVALGFKVRTGRAALVVLGGACDAPEILVKTRVDVAVTFEEGAVYHAAESQPLVAVRALVQKSERAFVERATRALEALLEPLGARVVGAAMAAPEEKVLPPLEQIMKAHPLWHAAEGELYRRVFAEASAAVGARAVRVPAEELASSVAGAVKISEAKLQARLSAMGKAAGRPWAAEQKEATLAAWLALAGA